MGRLRDWSLLRGGLVAEMIQVWSKTMHHLHICSHSFPYMWQHCLWRASRVNRLWPGQLLFTTRGHSSHHSA